MAAAHVDVTTDAPTLLIVSDLGDSPSLTGVSRYIDSLDTLGHIARAIASTRRPRSTRSGFVEKSDRLNLLGVVQSAASEKPEPSPLAVARMRMASPLEVVLTAAAGQFAPVAYGLMAMTLIERTMKLIMEWQSHRLDIRQRQSELHDQARMETSADQVRRVSGEIARTVTEEVYEYRLPDKVADIVARPISRLAQHRVVHVESSRD
ncbi:hypothetical protein [Micromonospora sp. NPDC005806]|uniref:hypothetical protein n=1 Tax=Micromonospora sp. NPDC005806 TaxID=3364234 RepID=UPI00367D062F